MIAVHQRIHASANSWIAYGAMSVWRCRRSKIMDKNLTPSSGKSYQFVSGDLRRRAELRLRKELALKTQLQPHEMGVQLFELRISQIEIELLSEEFNRLRKRAVVKEDAQNFRNTPAFGYVFLDTEGVVLEARFQSAQPGSLIGENWAGQRMMDYLLPEGKERFRDFLREIFNTNEKKGCELYFGNRERRKNASLPLPLHAWVEAISDESKQICLAVVEDISAQKLADEREKSISSAFKMLNQTLEASQNEIFVFDTKDLKFSFANQRALQNLGYSMEELKWLTPLDIQSHVFNQEMADLMDHMRSNKKEMKKINAVHLRKDGSRYPVEIHLQLFEQEAESYFIAIALDISNQATIESQLKSIVESAWAIIWAADTDLNFMFISDKVFDLLGYRADRFIGSSFFELLDSGLLHTLDKAEVLDGLRQVLEDGSKVSALRYRLKHADGSWRWLSMNITPVVSVDGQVSQIVGVMHDIHAQKQAEDALLELTLALDLRVQVEIQKNQEKDLLLQQQSRLAGMGEMIGNIAHQWRQPINALGLILSDLEDAALYGECNLSYIHSSVGKSKSIIQKMSRTIDDFRHFFRADKSLEEFSLHKATLECINLVDASMKNSNISISVQFERDVLVSGYSSEYSQVLMNILSNARDAIIERNVADGRINIDISEDADFGVHAITDNGGGIPLDVLPKIFEPHFTTKEHGVGIGLYMTLVAVEKNMNGKIFAENAPSGARFIICLPKAKSEAEYVIH